MSVSYNHRRKFRKKLKKLFPNTWQARYDEFVANYYRDLHGPLIGTLADIMQISGEKESLATTPVSVQESTAA